MEAIEFVIDMQSQIHYTPSCKVGFLSTIAKMCETSLSRFSIMGIHRIRSIVGSLSREA